MAHSLIDALAKYRWSLAAISLMLFIAGGRLAVVANYGSDLPIFDSWAADTNAFVIPLGTNTLSPKTLFYPTNEHRVFFTNLCNALLAAVSGQWDNRQQTVLNAFLCGAVLAGFWHGLARRQPGPWPAISFALVGAAGGLPIVFENIVWGFQSQFSFVAGFSLYSLWQLLNARLGTTAWHSGWIAGVCALLSFGSGFVSALVLLAISLIWLFHGGDAHRRQLLLNIVVASLLLGFAWMIHPPAPHHDILHAKNPGQFVNYLLAGMAWPATGIVWLAPIIYAPLAWLSWRWLREPEFRHAHSTFLFGAGLWVGLQIAAIAYTRSNTTMWPPANRYGELYIYGIILNVAAGVLLLNQGFRGRAFARVLVCLALGAFVVGATTATRYALTQKLPALRTDFRAYEKSVATYLQSPDRSRFSREKIPYPSSEILANLLDMPAVQKYLPWGVHHPADNPSNIQLLLGKTRPEMSFISRVAADLSQNWPIVIGLGSILLAGSVAPRLFKRS